VSAPEGEPGTVVAAHGRRYRVVTGSGETLDCVTRSRKSDVACGDRVRVARSGGGVGVIESVEARVSLFYRSDARRQKLIAANVDQVMVVVAPVPAFHPELVDRCLAAAEHESIASLIVLNKTDLAQSAQCAQALALYRALGYRLVELSALRDASPLLPHLQRRTTLLVGQSGMGKSTLVNALVPGAAARVASISAALRSGRHTTTHAELYRVSEASAVIDSPGMQEFGLHHLTVGELARAFIEFRPLIGQCRFRDCRHLAEPQCAIALAAAEGAIAPSRLQSYRRLAAERVRHPQWS
jgi:ribosome biogenesis GTPase / thiamine phosphate phosphatase